MPGSGKLNIFKNNVDYFGNTYGAHENYLVSPLTLQQIRILVPFLTTRQIFAGAGKVADRWEPGEVPYQLTQRADFIEQVFSDRATQVRGIINTRKRELLREGQNMRLHVIVGDSNMSEYAIGLKLGTTGLVLRLLEEGALDGIPSLSLPVQDLRRVSRSFKAALRMEGRRSKYTALDIQSLYLEKVHRYFSSRKASREEQEILKLWEQTLAGLEKLKVSATWDLEEDPEDLKRKIDWVLKLWLLSRFRKKDALDWNDLQLKSLDFRYHDLDPEVGLFERCQALGLVDRMVDEEEISRARIEPPRDTRARTRAMIIRKTADRNVSVQIENWEKITIFANRRVPEVVTVVNRTRRIVNALGVKLEDPFEARNVSVLKAVNRFLEIWD
jgi:proteasome accessory factor A